MNDILYSAPLYYPSAREWMWNYCMYLGPYTDSKGNNFDLGVYFRDDGRVSSFAIVHGNNPGDYFSGDFRDFNRGSYKRECYIEAARRVEELNLPIISYNELH